MSSDRAIYDEAAYLVKTTESSKPLSYVLNINAHENCQVCGEQPNVSKHVDRISLENDLLGINRKLSKNPKQQYQKTEKIAETLNYSPAYLCERNLQNKSFLNNKATNEYMENLRKLTPRDVRNIDTSKNMCKLTNYMNQNNIEFDNQV